MARALDGHGADGRIAAQPYLDAAVRAASFIRERMWNAQSGVLLRRYRDGHAEIDGYAEDYAYLIFGLLELFQAQSEPMWLEWAIALQRQQDTRFWDEQGGGWFSTDGRDPSVLLRMKEDYDGAEPTASSVSVLNLLQLSHLVEDAAWSDRIERTLRLFGTRLEQMGRGVPMMAAALSAYLAGMQQIVVVEGDSGGDELRRAIAMRYLPFAVTIHLINERRHALAGSLPFIAAMQPVNGARCGLRVSTLRLPATSDDGRSTSAGVGDDRMKVTVDVWLRGTDAASTETIDGITRVPRDWTDDDVRSILGGMLRAMDRRKRPGEPDREISLRGLSWIVNPYDEGGVVIAIEITLGAAVAGPFDIDKGTLEMMINRVLGPAPPASSTVH